MERPATNKEKTRTKSPYRIMGIILLVLVALAFIGIYVNGNLRYEEGKEQGKQEAIEQYKGDIAHLGNIVSVKAKSIETLSKLANENVAEIDKDGINEYIEKIKAAKSDFDTLPEEIKNQANQTLDEYLNSWQAFAESYASASGDAIDESFSTLKELAKTTSEKLTQVFNEAITKTAQGITD